MSILLKKKKGFLSNLFKNVYAENIINTVVQETNQTLTDGKANKLDNHTRVVYSKEIMFKAMPIMKFLQFAKLKTELGVQPGLEIQMMTYNNLKKGGKLQEGIHIETQAMSSAMKGIKVCEWGNATSVSELAYRTSFTNVIQDATTLLSRDYATVMDLELRDVALSATNVVYARLDSEAMPTGRDTVAQGLTVATIKDAVEILATNNTPKFEGNYYVCMIHPHQSRKLRDDDNWIDASKYAQPQSLFNGEIGRLENVRFIETTHMCNGAVGEGDPAYKAELATAGAGSKPIYQAILFGEDYYALATALPVELRDGGVEDYGRQRSLAWYAIHGMDKLNPERGVLIETL